MKLPNPGQLLVFAYGSNMLTARIKQRAPSSHVVAVGCLEGYELRWNKRSKDGSAKCNATQTGLSKDIVWGVVFKLDVTDKPMLDIAEGLGRGYGERAVNVATPVGQLRTQMYYATSIDMGVRPYDWYRALVIAGAREHDLPETYLRMLESVEAIADQDADRDATNRALLAARA